MIFMHLFITLVVCGLNGFLAKPLKSEENDEKMEDGMTLDVDARSTGMKDVDINIITVDQLHELLQNNDVRLIDVREPYELEREGKIGQSVNIPLGQLQAALKLSDDDFLSKYSMKKPAKDDCNLVFHCKSGGRSYKAMQMAKENGYKCPKSLKGGFTAWKEMAESG